MRGRLARVAAATMQAACLSRDRAEGVGKQPSPSPDRSSRIDNVLDRWRNFLRRKRRRFDKSLLHRTFPLGRIPVPDSGGEAMLSLAVHEGEVILSFQVAH